jgi:peptidoglycan/LPS O-acetylase OafA/YrhL
MNVILHSNPYSKPKYFFSLDVIRGLAALSVVLWHWQNLYTYQTVLPATFDRTQQPLYNIFFIFYNTGALAVDFFFALSGFIFFFLYAEKIARRTVDGKAFFVLRFSRLYPLHILTLIIVLVFQRIIYVSTGAYAVYPFNDTYHFILNLFFAQSWGLEKGLSFNSPSWSVSVEVLLYILFFILCRLKLNNRIAIAGAVIVGAVLGLIYSPVGRGVFSFYIGAGVYYIYLYLLKSKYVKRITLIIGLLCVAFFTFIFFESKSSFIESLLSEMQRGKMISGGRLGSIYNQCVRTIVFPFFILFLALLETIKGSLGKRIAIIGHISYSSYMLHFSLQLIVMYYVYKTGINGPALYNSPLMLAGFYIVLILLSLLSFYFFEKPIQDMIRKYILHRTKVVNKA